MTKYNFQETDYMNPREITEQNELQFLCEYACLSKDTKGRQRDVKKCELRTEFQRDRDKILHSNSFRRLKHKAQVFLYPTGDHYRTRLTHTLEVSQIARTIARALRLNEDLTEAISLGHDLGHTPFGHEGERVLNELNPNGFKHYKQSLRVVDYIDKLNLTYEVRDGIVKHTNDIASTKEGYIVRLADVIAYINHDIDDSIRAKVITEDDLPKDVTEVLGHSKSERITTLVSSIVKNGAKEIKMDEDVKRAHDKLHQYMFDCVYTNPLCKSEERKVKGLIEKLYEYYISDIDRLPLEYQELSEEFGIDTAVCDYIAGMTDSFAINTFEDLFIPKGWNGIS